MNPARPSDGPRAVLGALLLRVRAEDPLPVAARRVLRRHFERMLLHEAEVRAQDGAEPVHDMRVATRRLRAALRVFDDALPARESGTLARQLKWIAGALGRVRDLDVQWLRLEEDASDLPEGLAPALLAYR